MASDTIFRSRSSEQRWVDHITQTLENLTSFHSNPITHYSNYDGGDCSVHGDDRIIQTLKNCTPIHSSPIIHYSNYHGGDCSSNGNDIDCSVHGDEDHITQTLKNPTSFHSNPTTHCSNYDDGDCSSDGNDSNSVHDDSDNNSDDYSAHRMIDDGISSSIPDFFICIAIDESPVCIFRVPTTLSAVKPEAYAPHRIGLGPYHHFRPNLYHKMERIKLKLVKSFLEPTDQIPNPQHLLITKLKKLEPTIRECYDNNLDFDGGTLAWVIAIDALCLLHLFGSYNPGRSVYIDDERRKLVQDIMMLENQIPLILVKEVQKAIHPLSNSELKIRAFCDAHCPLELSKLANFDSCHLLGFMYNLILYRPQKMMVCMAMPGERIVKEAASQVLSMAGLGQTLKLFTYLINFPWDSFFADLFSKKSDEKKRPVNKITIHSASDLSRIGGVKFNLLAYGGIRGINFHLTTSRHDGVVPTLDLPVITLNVDSDVILRNLVAYESCLDSPGPPKLADYMDLMSGIIHTAKDVELLRGKKIVKGTLTDDEIVDLFNEISNSITSSKPNQKSYLQDTIDEVNQHFKNIPRVKARRFMENCGAALWKLLLLLAAVFMLVLLGSNAFCEIFGCKNHLFKAAAPNDVGFADVSSSAL